MCNTTKCMKTEWKLNLPSSDTSTSYINEMCRRKEINWLICNAWNWMKSSSSAACTQSMSIKSIVFYIHIMHKMTGLRTSSIKCLLEKLSVEKTNLDFIVQTKRPKPQNAQKLRFLQLKYSDAITQTHSHPLFVVSISKHIFKSYKLSFRNGTNKSVAERKNMWNRKNVNEKARTSHAFHLDLVCAMDAWHFPFSIASSPWNGTKGPN